MAFGFSYVSLWVINHEAKIEQVSGEVDRICSPGKGDYQEMVDSLRADAIQEAIKNGALPSSIRIVQQDILPLAYSDDKMVRAVVKAVSFKGVVAIPS
jgi:hypothetical protein